MTTVNTFDLHRAQRFAVFGFLDGIVGHTWYFTLEKAIGGSRPVDKIARIAADIMVSLPLPCLSDPLTPVLQVYTPLWCAWHVIGMALLEQENIWTSLQDDWMSMVRVSSSFFVPMSILLYTVVPLEHRVTAVALGTMVVTFMLSFWKATRSKSAQAAMDVP